MVQQNLVESARASTADSSALRSAAALILRAVTLVSMSIARLQLRIASVLVGLLLRLTALLFNAVIGGRRVEQ